MKIDWPKELQPLFQKYGKRQHPLDYKNRYQLVVMVVLSAQTTDDRVNQLGKDLFDAYPDMATLATAEPEDLHPYIRSVRNFGNKSKWLVKMAREIGEDKNIPHTMDGLCKLSGIARKSANVIIRESDDHAEGIICDLHVLRVAPRLGIVEQEDKPKPDKVEKQLMTALPQATWNEAGMSISFLGREICRPTNPKCPECMMNSICLYYKEKN
ncbi:MAG TPA: endonuclease III [Sunxiuqinia sp.]|nr:endonuclease III [Sunxiuqinia sp.]